MSKLFIILPVISSLLLFNGCRDSEINSFEEETGTYSVYGSIEMHDTDHVIRVRDLNTFFNSESSQNLDATVTFYDLEEGTSQVLQDSVVQFPANYTHNFLLNKAFKPSRRYKVAVERSNGESVSSMFTTPAITESEFFSVSRKVGCYTPFQLIFKNVMPDEQIRIEFGVKYDNKTYWFEFTNVCITEYFEDRHELVITAKPYLLLDFIWPKPGMDPPPNCRDIRYPTVLCDDLDSKIFGIRYYHLGPEWKKIYPVRPRIPDDVGDVENGLGFLGAYRQDTLSFTVDVSN